MNNVYLMYMYSSVAIILFLLEMSSGTPLYSSNQDSIKTLLDRDQLFTFPNMILCTVASGLIRTHYHCPIVVFGLE